MEFAPESVDVFLLVIHSSVLHQVVPYGRVGTICSNHEVEVDLDFFVNLPWSGFASWDREPGFVLLKIRSRELVVEEEFDIWQFLQFIQQGFVKPSSINSIVCLEVLSDVIKEMRSSTYSSVNVVRLRLFSELARGCFAVDHSSFQGNSLGKDFL